MLKKICKLFCLCTLLIGVAGLFAQDEAAAVAAVTETTTPAGWLNDFGKAQELAKAQNKAIMLFFTGSDWCGWCVKMHKDVLDTPEFKAFADANLVLVYVDQPRKKVLPPYLVAANNQLTQKYKKGGGVPHTIFVDAAGEVIGTIPGYAKDFIKQAGKLLKK